MIISPILMPMWPALESDFAVDIVNLEAVALTFRLRYTLPPLQTRPAGGVQAYRLGLFVKLKGSLTESPPWTKIGDLHHLAHDVTIGPGFVQHAGLHAKEGFTELARTDAASGRRTLRGYWDLSLPMVPSKSGREVVQLDHPARVLVTVSHHCSSDAAPPSFVVLPLASGKAEHFIPPDGPILGPAQVGGPRMSIVKRAATKRRRR